MKIVFNHVTTGYEKHPMICDLNFEIETGTATCILGANGIGKTTLFKTILKLIDLVSGDIIIDGKSIKKMNNKEIAYALSYVPQAKNYSYQYSVLDMVLMGRAMYINKFSEPSKKDFEIAEMALRQLDLYDFKDRMYSELSGGEQQIVLIARALAQEANFVVMDEPSSNLDFGNQSKLISTINLLRESGKGVLMASHSPDHAFACCQKVVLIFQDRSVLFGSTNDLLTKKNLDSVYGVDVSILTGTGKSGEPVHSCTLY